MTLPAIEIPKIELPFDIEVLIHPAVVHFTIVLPIVILLLEFYNLFAKKKSIGGFSFLLIILMIVVFAAAYLTGSVDGKEAYDLLIPEGQEALKGHKLLGTYLVFASIAVLFFKLLAMTGKSSLKFLFFIVLIGFSAVTLQQGKNGGELVFKYGANIERVQTLDDELFDAKDALEDLQAEKKPLTSNADEVTESVTEKADKGHTELKEVQTVPEQLVDDKPSTTNVNEDNVSTDNLVENISEKTDEINETTRPWVENSTEDVVEEVIEVIPSDIARPKIETH